MKKGRIKELKQALENCLSIGDQLSHDEARDLLDLMDRVFPKMAAVEKDPSPMIGDNPFKRPAASGHDYFISDGDHFRVDHPSHTMEKVYKLLNEESENGG